MTLEREIRLLRRVTHPNIVQLHEVLHCTQEQTAYLIFEWASLGSLTGAALDMTSMASVFRQICEGLSYLHSQGIVHHDIKPSNILLFEDGIAKLCDLGIGHSFASTDFVVGTPAYQAPEFFDDDSDVILDPIKEDVWSLGISLYEVAFGYLPFLGANMYEVNWNIKNSPLVIPEGCSPVLSDLIRRMLDLDPALRLSLAQVIDHPFFADSRPRFSLPVAPPDRPRVGASRSLVPVVAQICDENHTFCATARSRSWSGLYAPANV
jgi:serine/threonine-protein kinase 11